MRWLVLLILVLSPLACTTYREDLNRGQRLYEEDEYERALAIWRYLEADIDTLDHGERARYAYFRGMTDYRLGGGSLSDGATGAEAEFRAEARHWLAIAKAIEMAHPGGLSEPWKQRLDSALEDLNAEVYEKLPATLPR